MLEQPEDFGLLIKRLREGSEDAAQELFKLYGHHVRRVVRRKLHQKLRSKFDSEDFTQAVWASFFAAEPRQLGFDRPEALVAFLAVLAKNKVIDMMRQRRTKKYDVSRERPLGGGDSTRFPEEPPARQDTPSQIAIGKEQWDRLLQGQPPHYRRILEMLRDGHTYAEVAQQVGINEKTVQRLVRKLAPEIGL
jgi:RNA polymerase sigma factor (sigma-70 family)